MTSSGVMSQFEFLVSLVIRQKPPMAALHWFRLIPIQKIQEPVPPEGPPPTQGPQNHKWNYHGIVMHG